MRSFQEFLLFFLLILPFVACNHTLENEGVKNRTMQINDSIDILYQEIQEGDLALRLGNDITSNMLAALNTKDKRFSHIGICFVENNEKIIYHIIGGEGNNQDYLLKVPLDTFFNINSNLSFGYAQTNFSNEEKNKLHEILKKWYQAKIAFDLNFDLNTNDKMYCSELVAKALEHSKEGLKIPITDTFKERYIGIDNIIDNAFVKQVFYIKKVLQ